MFNTLIFLVKGSNIKFFILKEVKFIAESDGMEGACKKAAAPSSRSCYFD
jgi:hypothetical protein